MSTTLTQPVETPSAGTTGAPPPAPDWRSSLPEDLRSSPTLEKFKDVGTLAKSYTELEKKAGSAVKMPGNDAKPEDWDAFYARLGRPESADKYTLKKPETLPPGITYDESLEKSVRPMFYKAGLNDRQAQVIMDEYLNIQSQRVAEYTKGMEDGVGELKKEWGGEFDKNMSMAIRAVNEVGGPELKDLLNSTGLGNHPVLIKMFANLGASMVEDTHVIGNTVKTDDSSMDALKTKRMELMKSPAYNSKMDNQEHRDAVDAVFKLTQQLYPDGGTGNATR